MENKDLKKILKSISEEERRYVFDEKRFVKDTLGQIKKRLSFEGFYGIIFYNCAQFEIRTLIASFSEGLKEFKLKFKTLDKIVSNEFLSDLKPKIKEGDFYFICHPDILLKGLSSDLIEPFFRIDIETIKGSYKKVSDNFP